MNLIEQFGYEAVKSELKNKKWRKDNLHGSAEFTWHMEQHIQLLEAILLQYRRQHNIFERNDYVVNKDIKYSDELNIVSASNDKALWFFGKIYGGFVKSQFRHATNAEIKAGKRL